MSELIYKDDGEPFATVEAAKAKRTRMGKEGLDSNVVVVENGYAIEQRFVKKGKRIPIGTRNVLSVDPRDKDPNFNYRIVNDDPGRIRMFKEAGWEIVKEKIQIGDDQAGTGKELGKIAAKQVGSGKRAYLMRVPKEFYEEDQVAKEAKIQKTESAMKQEPNKKGQYGDVKIKQKNTPN